MMGAKVITIVLHFAFTFILARLLTPEDFGIVAMVLAITVFAEIFKDAGLSAAAIQRKDLSDDQQSNLFWLNFAVGLVLTLIVASLAPAIAWFYDRTELIAVTLALSLSFVITGIAEQHRTRLLRDMRFAPNAVAGVLGMAARLLVAVYLASLGYGYWAIIWGTLSGLLLTSVIIVLQSEVKIMLPKRNVGTFDFISFGARVMVFNCANFFHKNLDNILLGRFFGAGTLGHYTTAYTLAMYPVSAIRSALNVAFPVLSKLQDDPDQYKHFFLNIVKVISIISVIPLMFGIVWGDLLLTLFLGPGWEMATKLFVILCIAGLVHPAGTMREVLLLSLGRSKKYARWGIYNAAGMTLAFAAGIWWGAFGMAWAYVFGTYLILYPSLRYVLQGTNIKPKEYLTAMFSSVLLTLPAVAASFGLHYFLSGKTSDVLLLALITATYSIAVLITVFSVSSERKLVMSVVNMLRKKSTAALK